MSQRLPWVAFAQMPDYSRLVVRAAGGTSRADLSEESMETLGLIYAISVVGEAAARVPEETRVLFPEIPWRLMVAMRNRMIHGYDQIDLDRVWQVATEDMPPIGRSAGTGAQPAAGES